MNDQFLLVRPMRAGDLLSDVMGQLTLYGQMLNCRFMLMVVDPQQQQEQQTQQVSVEEVVKLEQPAVSGQPSLEQDEQQEMPQLVRRQMGGSIFLGDESYPTNDDLAAVRTEINKLGSNAIRVLVINPHYGEVELAIMAGNEAATVFVVGGDDFESSPSKQVFDANVFMRSSIRFVREEAVAELRDPENVDALIIVDPRPDDFSLYSRHLRHNGLFMLVATNGSSPDVPQPLTGKMTEITPSVYCYFRKAESSHAK
jgi:hypothetical protein